MSIFWGDMSSSEDDLDLELDLVGVFRTSPSFDFFCRLALLSIRILVSYLHMTSPVGHEHVYMDTYFLSCSASFSAFCCNNAIVFAVLAGRSRDIVTPTVGVSVL